MSVKAYEGSLPYIFVSYSHRDSAEVLPVIEALENHGYRVWFDGGIEAGSEWPEYIASHIDKCACVLNFVSKNYEGSFHCKSEMVYALDRKKPFLSVYLIDDDSELSGGLRMQLGLNQALWRKNFSSEKDFVNAVCPAKLFGECKSGDGTGGVSSSTVGSEAKKGSAPDKKSGKKKKKGPLIALLLLIVAVAVAVGCIVSGYSDNKDGTDASDTTEADGASDEQSDTPKGKEIVSSGLSIVLPEDFFDYPDATYDVSITNGKIHLGALKMSFTDDPELEQYTVRQYADLFIMLADVGLSSNDIVEEDGLVYVRYDPKEGEDDFVSSSIVFFYKSHEAFWIIDVSEEKPNFDEDVESFKSWAKTVKFYKEDGN